MSRNEALQIMRQEAVDFSRRLAPIYKSLDWEWVTDDGEYRVPGSDEIYDTITRLIDRLGDEESTNILSGGIRVFIECESDSDYWEFGIEFILSKKWSVVLI